VRLFHAVGICSGVFKGGDNDATRCGHLDAIKTVYLIVAATGKDKADALEITEPVARGDCLFERAPCRRLR